MSKKEEIIKVARDLFKTYGYKKVSMDEIAKNSNVTKKTIYSYFKDKDELFQYFITEELEEMKTKFENSTKNIDSVSKRISIGLKEILEFRKKSLLVSNIAKDELINGNKNNFLNQYDEEIINYLEDKINEEIAKKTIKKCNSNLTAFIIYKIFFAIFFEYNKELDETSIIEEVDSILKNGLIIGGDINEK